MNQSTIHRNKSCILKNRVKKDVKDRSSIIDEIRGFRKFKVNVAAFHRYIEDVRRVRRNRTRRNRIARSSNESRRGRSIMLVDSRPRNVKAPPRWNSKPHPRRPVSNLIRAACS